MFFCVFLFLACSEDVQKTRFLEISNSEFSQCDDLDDSLSSLCVLDQGSSMIISDDSSFLGLGHSLFITEINPINLIWFDETGLDPGWVEIYNAGSDTINLNGYSLVENMEDPRKWVFGDEKIGPKKYRTVFCDKLNIPMAHKGIDSDSTHFRTHTNWKLEKDGGVVYLIDSNWSIQDSAVYPALESGVSWGRVDNGVWKYFGVPTPEKKNADSQSYTNMAQSVVFDEQEAGFYDQPITLNPPISPDGAAVRCTFDGSVPTKDSPVFSSSQILDSSTVVRCGAFKEGLLTKTIVTNTFFIGESVNMPIVSIAVDPYDMFDSVNGYYSQGVASCAEPCFEANYFRDIELPVHVEFFESSKEGASRAWNIDAGLSIMGGWSRYNDKKSVSITMREQYQDGRLLYPLFETKPDVNVFKAFNLRNNGNRFQWDYIEDAMGGALLEGSDVDYQRSRQVVVFYNGKYWGIHDLRERYNEHYVETHYGIEASTVESIKHVVRQVSQMQEQLKVIWRCLILLMQMTFLKWVVLLMKRFNL